jgi:hypothetical protein
MLDCKKIISRYDTTMQAVWLLLQYICATISVHHMHCRIMTGRIVSVSGQGSHVGCGHRGEAAGVEEAESRLEVETKP